jgi:hypothetical protein
MKRHSRIAGLLAGAVLLGLAAVRIQTGHAEGIPTMNPLFYAGTLTDMDKPVDGTRRIQLSLWSVESGDPVAGRLCLMPGVDLTITAGHFRLPLSPECLAVVRATPDVFVELGVVENGETMAFPRRKIGAVPFAIEAARASEAAGGLKAQLAALEGKLPAARTAFHYFKTGSQTAINGAWTRLQFDSKLYDDGADFDGTSFLVKDSGTYQVTCSVMYRGAGTDLGTYVAAVVTNPDPSQAETSQVVSASINGYPDQSTVVATRVARLTAGQTLTCMAYQSSQGDKTVYAEADWARAPRNFFNVTRLF